MGAYKVWEHTQREARIEFALSTFLFHPNANAKFMQLLLQPQ